MAVSVSPETYDRNKTIYLITGLILFIVLGLCWVHTAFLILFKLQRRKHAPMLIFYISAFILIMARIYEYSV
jgi:hypothetical protein